jgi:hypothetical protein
MGRRLISILTPCRMLTETMGFSNGMGLRAGQFSCLEGHAQLALSLPNGCPKY